MQGRHNDAAAHSAGSIQSSPRQADGFIHGNLTWRLFCAQKDGVRIRIQKWIFPILALKWESRAGLLSLGYSSKTYHSCKLHTQYLQPSQLLLSPSLELAVPAKGEKPHFYGRGLGSTGTTGPIPHLHTLCPEPSTKGKYKPKCCVFPDTSKLRAL